LINEFINIYRRRKKIEAIEMNDDLTVEKKKYKYRIILPF
jgi:hypothetical protein